MSFLALCLFTAACGQSASSSEGSPAGQQPDQHSLLGEAAAGSVEKAQYPDYTGKIVISEIMPKNSATRVNGRYDDWVELLNLSDEHISLDGWKLKGKDSLDLSGTVIEPNEYLMIFSEEDFAVKDDSVLSLTDPKSRIVSSADIPEMDSNVSLELNDSGVYALTLYPTPGYENSRSGYCDYQDTLFPDGDIVISEVVVFNASVPQENDSAPVKLDWVEIRNISESKVDLSDYSLTDKPSEPGKYSFPEMELMPGEYLAVTCAAPEEIGFSGGKYTAPFGLNSENETLILYKNGELEDCISLKDIPYGCSFGRMDSEAGFFYFAEPSYGKKNINGCRCVSGVPSASVPGGQYQNDTLTVELNGTGTIYYTLDSTEPTFASSVYSEPLKIDESTVLRAFSCEEGQLRSRSVTYNYLLGTDHTLPVVCINANSAKDMARMYSRGKKDIELPGNISYYDGSEGFSENCSISMNGATSLFLVKRSMKVRFSGAYGSPMLKYDLFHDGTDEFNSLVLRVGQDYYNGVIRNELCQAMARQFSEDLLTQHGKWCVVYVNGKYYGVHALKEDNGAYLYANRYGVSRNSVTVDCGDVPADSALYPAIHFILTNDMSDEENYRKAADMLDMNSLADWIIAIGYSGHPDVINGNYKLAASTEDDGKIRLIYYDLDTSLQRPEYPFINIFSPSSETQMFWMCRSLFRNNEFRKLTLERASDALHGAFSDENALALIDKMAEEIDSEMMNDAPRWHVLTYTGWKGNINRLKTLMTNYHSSVINNLRAFMNLTNEEIETYFGDLD